MAPRPPRRGKKESPERDPSPVALFPPLPRVPPPPDSLADPRQTNTARILGVFADAASPTHQVSGANLSTGFPAASVDLGRLQQALEDGLARFDAAQLEARWPKLNGWIHSVLGAWVQRRKMVKIERREKGIRIELETQDDLGYYTYGFDVFPSRKKAGRGRKA